jgi:hypothetical protein
MVSTPPHIGSLELSIEFDSDATSTDTIDIDYIVVIAAGEDARVWKITNWAHYIGISDVLSFEVDHYSLVYPNPAFTGDTFTLVLSAQGVPYFAGTDKDHIGYLIFTDQSDFTRELATGGAGAHYSLTAKRRPAYLVPQ